MARLLVDDGNDIIIIILVLCAVVDAADECSKCSVNARCVKLYGQFLFCKCKRGFVGNGNICFKKQSHDGR